jgi:hypothetical protein
VRFPPFPMNEMAVVTSVKDTHADDAAAVARFCRMLSLCTKKIRQLLELKLYEISVTPFPMNEMAVV